MLQVTAQLYRRWSKRLLKRVLKVPFGCRSIIVASLAATLLVTGVKSIGLLQRFELWNFDSLSRLRPSIGNDPRIMIVGITEDDLQRYGWPLSDQVVAIALKRIQQYQPRVIGLDLYRSNPNSSGREALKAQLSAQNLITIINVGDSPSPREQPYLPDVPWERIGFNDIAIDPDGVVRRSLLFVDFPDKAYYAFPLRVALAYLAPRSIRFSYTPESMALGEHELPLLAPHDGGYQNIDSSGYQILLRYRSSPQPVQTISLQQLLEGDFETSQITDNIVLLGAVAPSLKDDFYTPYSGDQRKQVMMSGITLNAHIISHLLDIADGKPSFYRFFPRWGETLWILIWASIAGFFTWHTKRPVVLFILNLGLILLLWGLSSTLVSILIWTPLVEPLVGFLVAGAMVIGQKALYRGTYDGLTDLPGREILLQEIRRALGDAQHGQLEPVVLAFLDIDRFRLINESLGHFIGDRVLLTIAHRLRQQGPHYDCLARVGGDEFAILFSQRLRADVEHTLENLQGMLSMPVTIDGKKLSISSSLGITTASDPLRQQPADLLRDAHTAMYRAKALGERRFETFSQDMHEAANHRLNLESDLLNALEKNEFELYYQPIISLESGYVSGFEALIKWRRQDGKIVPTGEFIKISEEIGLIIPIGQWVMQQACRQLSQWQQTFPHSPLTMSINLSRQQFTQPDLVQQVAAILRDTHVSGHHIQLEITESMLMRNIALARSQMLALKELNIQLAIDDFGTGYSSLSYLHRFPTDTLKIDQSFVASIPGSLEDCNIIQTIIVLGQKLNMTVVAEGIETEEQLRYLETYGCQKGQGYFFARPLSSQQATQLLKRAPNWLRGPAEAREFRSR
ncbi:putative bifunctional diguanylate cyclase/phosphodiesterase [Leptothoe sp. PORK10 BA2]|uniref:putative bifunctional diguanylate cyclase/phosphodiesterase n=1 Tax=Leptothoe sp. PORK10 BA2 TaxID=3110254 RepID=UPI002B2169B3|nr:EAL domain-containing protein [Leptothoe sp. PORK10 BA2]MEA5466342.1 EAL domain-containing protein [Leptothoe sp. PORK10 BA2]